MAINGGDILLMKNGLDMMAVVSHDVESEADIIETASATQGQWREYMGGRKSWIITANTLKKVVHHESSRGGHGGGGFGGGGGGGCGGSSGGHGF